MNNCNQLLEKAESLKKELGTRHNGLAGDGSESGELVSNRTSLQDVYRQLLITNLEYALDKKIEQDLWNYVFKNHITALQQQAKDKSNTHRSDAQCQLTVFLDAATGFYSLLLDDLCRTFQVNLPCRVPSSKFVFLKGLDTTKQNSITQPERPSCQYMCQHCLVHLGDIARYRNQINQAESYYRHAAQLVPSGGQPYNQLAILAAASGDVLSTAFYYCRSLAVKCPFPGSDTNLRRQLSKIMAGDEPRHTKISTSEIVRFSLKFHACIYLKKGENELKGMVDRLSSYVRAHLRAGSLSKQQIIHMTFLNLFSLMHLSPNGVNVSGDPVGSINKTKESELETTDDNSSNDNNTPWSAILTFTMNMLGGLLASVPAHSDDASELEHPAVPAIKLTLDWISANISVLQKKEVSQNSRVWCRFAKVLNALGNQDRSNNFENRPLPEDLEVRGFVGLRQPLSKLDFQGGVDNSIPEDMEHACRSYRLFLLGSFVSSHNSDLLSTSEESTGTMFSSNVAPSPQHGDKVNGLKEEEGAGKEEDEDLDLEVEAEIMLPPPKINGRRYKDLRPSDSSGGPRRSGLKNKGALKVSSDDFSNSRKKNRAPRMQNVAVQIKPDNKLKVIKEEEGAYSENLFHHDMESERGSNESSQGDSMSPVNQSRSGHRVTFGATQQMSPTQYSQEDTPSPGPVPCGFVEQVGMVIPSLPMYSEPQLLQQPYGMQLISQQIGPVYRHPSGAGTPPGNSMLSNPYVRRGPPLNFSKPQNMMTRSQMQQLSYQQQFQPMNTPPNPSDLPKPSFQGPMFPNQIPVNMRPPNMSPVDSMPAEKSNQMSRPRDLGMFLNQQNPSSTLSSISPSQDMSPLQRPIGPGPNFQRPGQGPNLPMTVLQQLRLHERAKNAEAGAEPTNPHFENIIRNLQPNVLGNTQRPGLDFSQFSLNQQQQMFARIQQQQQNQSAKDGNDGSHGFDLSGISSEHARNFFHRNFTGPSPTSQGGSNNTSSTSSPTPGAIQPSTSTCSPQAGSRPNPNFANSMLSHGMPSILDANNMGVDMPRRPNTLAGTQRIQQTNTGFVGSPGQKPLTPGSFPNFNLLNNQRQQQQQQQQQLKEGLFQRDTNPLSVNPSLFGGMPSTNSQLVDSFGQIGKNVNMNSRQSPSELYPNYTVGQNRVKAIFNDTMVGNPDKMHLTQNHLDALHLTNSNQQQSKFLDSSLLSKEDKDSYKLFPEPENIWGGARGHRGGDGLGLTGLGTIGSERAAAQQSQYSPWGFPGAPNKTSQESVRAQAPQPYSEGNPQNQSLWSSPMMPSGPSTLEQLILQQNQQHHSTRDKAPP